MEDSITADCVICFSRIENFVFLPDEESQKIVNNIWSFLHENIANSKSKTGKWENGNPLPFCNKCFEAAFELIQYSEKVAKWQKEILDLSFAFSFAVLLRRTQVESTNNNSDVQNSPNSPKQLILLDVSAISPWLFSMDQLCPIKTEDFEHPCDDNFRGNVAVLRVPQEEPVEIEIHEFKVAVDDNLPVLCHDTTGNSINNPIVQEEVKQDGLTISKTKRTSPANKTEVAKGSERNKTSRTADSGSAESDLIDENITKEIPTCSLPVVLLTKLNKANSAKFNSTSGQSSSDSSNLKHRLRKKRAKKDAVGQSTSSIVINGETGRRRLQKVITSGSSLKVGGRPRATAVKRREHEDEKYECFQCEKVFANLVLLDEHILIHTGEKEKPFKCSVCSKAFGRLASVKKHETIHTGKRSRLTMKCSYCTRRFKTLDHFYYHEYTHTGEKPFKCSFCKMGFFTLSHLRRHESTHSYVRVYKRGIQ